MRGKEGVDGQRIEREVVDAEGERRQEAVVEVGQADAVKELVVERDEGKDLCVHRGG
jgi:hypothetical protein